MHIAYTVDQTLTFVSNLPPDKVNLLKSVFLVSQAIEGPDLDFDIDIPPWNAVDTCSTCTGTATHVYSCVKHGYHVLA